MLIAQSFGDLPWGVVVGPFALTGFLLYVVVWGGRKRWWVFGWVYDAKEQEAKDWKALAMSGADTSEHGVKVAEKAVDSKLEELARFVDDARRRGEIQ